MGEQPENEICGSFRPRGFVPNLPIAPEIQLNPDKPLDFDYAAEFRRVYGEQLQIERDLFETTAQIQSEFFLDQSPATVDQAFAKYVQKLADLRLLHVLTGLFECDVYRDSIMAAEIERQFGVKPKPETVQQIQSSVKEMNRARIPGVPTGPAGTVMGGTVSSRPPRQSRRSTVQTVAKPEGTAKKSRPT